MVQKIFRVQRSATADNGWDIIIDDDIFEMPESVYASLSVGKWIGADDFLSKVETMQIALAGVTDSLNVVDAYSLDMRSVLKSVVLIKDGTINDDIGLIRSRSDGEPESIIKQYEEYHTIYMDRDIDGDDGSIHAYIKTPNNGTLRCVFDRSIRLNAKRNNIKYWVDDYSIDAGSNGGEFVRPSGVPVEI